jgi:hypothetical protein
MLINKQHPFLFVHIQRTGGSSIRKILMNALPETEFFGSHDHALHAKNHLNSEWSDYYKIAFVRNPWERILSWYAMISQSQQGEISEWYQGVLGDKTDNKLWQYVFNNSKNFEEFLFNCTEEIDDIDGKKSFSYNQLDYISDEQGHIMVDFIGRYENYQQDVQRLCQKLGIEKIEIPRVWSSKHNHYSEYYTEKTAELVAKRFAKDIDFFGYQFEKE